MRAFADQAAISIEVARRKEQADRMFLDSVVALAESVAGMPNGNSFQRYLLERIALARSDNGGKREHDPDPTAK